MDVPFTKDAAEVDPPSSVQIVSRALLRRAYRRAADVQETPPVVLLLGGYPPKLRALAESIYSHGSRQAVSLAPRMAQQGGADAIAELLGAQGLTLGYVVPLVDCAAAVADVLNSRLGKPCNSPATSHLRRDKFMQQECLRAAGLPAPAQRLVSDADSAAEFAAERFMVGPGHRVVVKPRDASGGDGTWLCSTLDDIREAVSRELGRHNLEGSVNRELIVMDALVGEEWVVNSVSLDGVHKVTDVWRGPPKVIENSDAGPAHFVYSEQFMAGDCPEREEIITFCAKVLDILEVMTGAAHTELLWTAEGPQLLEVNARPAGGLPRTPLWPNQLQALTMAIFEAPLFHSLPGSPKVCCSASKGCGAAVVFLRAPFDGWIQGSSLVAMMALGTFHRFERDLLMVRPGTWQVSDVSVRKTRGLATSPGALVFQGAVEDVRSDVEAARRLELTAYTSDEHRQDSRCGD